MDKSKIKVVFMGTSFFSKEILKIFVENNYKISLVITTPDKEAGRKKIKTPSLAKKFAGENKIAVASIEKFDEKTIAFVKDFSPDLVVVASFGIIIPKEIIDLPRFGCINFHPSLLPQLRGPSPIQTALLENRKKSGLTLMKMDEMIDHGEIICQKTISVDQNDDYFSLEKKMIILAEDMIAKNLPGYLDGKSVLIPQNHQKATFTKIIKKENGKIDWSKNAEKIYAQYRAFKNWPGIFCFWEEKSKKISFTKISVEKSATKQKAGKVFKDEKKRICVQTIKGKVILKEIQMEGKNEMKIENFINGYADFIGANLK